ncbi:MAG: argininosuccinate lyase [Chitinophagaceae bacterium]|nr:argininosuccinate lyase [Chitinophagaceae bacterium]
MKLWSKENTETSKQIEQFTVGRDNEFDILLAEHDVTGTIAHVAMLKQSGLMEGEEAEQALKGLKDILAEIKKGEFTIEPGIEDIHSQVELLLTRRIGEAGKKIHSGRSRNDQVAVDIKLFIRAEIFKIRDEVKNLFDLLIAQSERYKDVLIPGYTHLQIAMPSSAGLWLGAYAESLVDDLEMLAAAYAVANKNPLGSGAGYGSSFPLNRTLTTELLGFKTLNHNAVYAQMGRGKTEKIVSQALASVAATLSKLSMDCCLYLSQNFSFISFPAELTTGSSIMPHKKNPDVFELVRAHCNRLQAIPNELTILLNNLPSGYHRDLQLTKEILFPAFETLRSCIEMVILMISNISFREDILKEEKYRYLFSVEAVNELVNQGIPFREAYKQVGEQIERGEFNFDFSKGLNHTHEGSLGNLHNAQIQSEMTKVLSKIS